MLSERRVIVYFIYLEIQKLREESVKGEHVEWEELKREYSL